VHGRSIGDTDEVEAEGKGLLLYLFRNRHFLRILNGCNLILYHFMTERKS
jgi:hypothetical protein